MGANQGLPKGQTGANREQASYLHPAALEVLDDLVLHELADRGQLLVPGCVGLGGLAQELFPRALKRGVQRGRARRRS
jgi:hypothetical protein